MVLDTSSLVAILSGEPEQQAFIQAIEQSDVRLVSAATLLEASIVIETRYGSAGAHHLDRLLERAEVEVVPVDGEQASAARAAWRRYGKGHPAALNFGDCFSYALAVTRGEPLLFKGNDFSQTDVPPVSAP